MPIAQDVFDQSVRPLPVKERLVRTIDADDAWSEQDEHDVTSFCFRHAEILYPEGEEFG